ncbi:hypothetical protein WJX74_009029 [Apatococcus lobatus]|uniref:Pentatricopeptide repeat-containing protein n=1 Tax=Apatococcus lobatus TaxID=904363 RepID=A0AAW1QBG8_9CHLO
MLVTGSSLEAQCWQAGAKDRTTTQPHKLCNRRVTCFAQADDQASSIRKEVTKSIKALGRAKKPKEAVAQLHVLAEAKLQPDRQAATALVDACARNGAMVMAQKAFDELFGKGLEPDEITFAILLRGYGNQKPPAWSQITRLMGLMVSEHGCPPDIATFNVLLEICARTKDQDRGFEMIDRMRRAGVEPDEFTLEAVKHRRVLRSYLRRSSNIETG